MFDGTKRIEVLDIFHDGEVKGYKEGKEEGRDERSDEVVRKQIKGYLKGTVSLEWAADTSEMTEEKFLEAVEAYKAEEKATEESSGS